jgi:hypothetical protein
MSRRVGHRGHWVEDGGQLVPRFFFDPPDLQYRRDVCKVCDGTGVTLETLDEERYDVAMPCWSCRMLCKVCNKYVKKAGHECAGPVPEKEKQR